MEQSSFHWLGFWLYVSIFVTYRFTGVDEILLNMVQRVVDWIGRWTNRTNFTLAVDIAILLVVYVVWAGYPSVVKILTGIIITSMVVAFLFWRASKYHKSGRLSQSGEAVVNPLRIDPVMLQCRAVAVSYSLTDLLRLRTASLKLDLFLLCLVFVLCCDSPPPGTTARSLFARVSEWVRGKVMGPVPAVDSARA